MAFGEDEAGKREERNRRQRGRHAERVRFDQHGRRRHAVAHEQQHGCAAEDGKDRRAKRRRDKHHEQAGPCRAMLEQPGISDEREPDSDTEKTKSPSCPSRPSRLSCPSCPPCPSRSSCLPRKPQRDQRKADGKRELSDPRGDAGRDDGARLALAQHELDGAPRENGRHAGRDRRCKRRGGFAHAAGRDERTGRKRQQLPLARRNRSAEESNPQREVLNERARTGNADAEQPADDDLRERQRDHRGQRQRSDAVFKRRKQSDHLAGEGCCWR